MGYLFHVHNLMFPILLDSNIFDNSEGVALLKNTQKEKKICHFNLKPYEFIASDLREKRKINNERNRMFSKRFSTP